MHLIKYDLRDKKCGNDSLWERKMRVKNSDLKRIQIDDALCNTAKQLPGE